MTKAEPQTRVRASRRSAEFGIEGATGDALLLDVTDPWQPRRITGTGVSGSMLTVRYERRRVRRACAARSRPACARRRRSCSRSPGNLRDPADAADYLIVTPDEFCRRGGPARPLPREQCRRESPTPASGVAHDVERVRRLRVRDRGAGRDKAAAPGQAAVLRPARRRRRPTTTGTSCCCKTVAVGAAVRTGLRHRPRGLRQHGQGARRVVRRPRRRRHGAGPDTGPGDRAQRDRVARSSSTK